MSPVKIQKSTAAVLPFGRTARREIDIREIFFLLPQLGVAPPPSALAARKQPLRFLPSGADERMKMGVVGYAVCPGDDAIRPGLAEITVRIDSGTPTTIAGACLKLLGEVGLYWCRADRAERKAELAVDENNHVISALRYLTSKIDARSLKGKPESDPAPAKPQQWQVPRRAIIATSRCRRGFGRRSNGRQGINGLGPGGFAEMHGSIGPLGLQARHGRPNPGP
jgi:hypothetical protein